MPDWTEISGTSTGLRQLTNGKNDNAGLTFNRAFRHFSVSYISSIAPAAPAYIYSSSAVCMTYPFPPPAVWTCRVYSSEVGSAIFFGGALSLECYLFLYVR